MPKIKKILFVQHRDVIGRQREEVEHVIKSELGVPVALASSPEDVPKGAPYDVVIAPTVPWLADLLVRLPQLRWVHFLSAGVEKIWDMEFDWEGINISKSSGVHAVPMSEYALGAMLYFAKEFDNFTSKSREKTWQRSWLGELTDKNLVILGMGSVGSAVAQRAASLGMNVLGVATQVRKHLSHRIEAIGTLHEHLPTADYVVLTLPLTPKTEGLVDHSFFASLKQGAVLVDVSRGGITQTGPLLSALDSGHLRGAALDVFEEEPLDHSSPLWNRNNVLVTPHVAGTTPHYLSRALEIFVANAQEYENRRPLKTPVDPLMGY